MCLQELDQRDPIAGRRVYVQFDDSEDWRLAVIAKGNKKDDPRFRIQKGDPTDWEPWKDSIESSRMFPAMSMKEMQDALEQVSAHDMTRALGGMLP